MRVENRDSAARLLQASTLLIDEELCLNLRGRLMTCTTCQDRCESEALILSADAVDLDSERCTGCGGCVPGCPAGVLHLSGFSPLRFLESLKGTEQVHIYCRESVDGGGGVVIPCHKLLDARLLAGAKAEGTQTCLLHGLSHCAGCTKGDASVHLDAVVETLRSWFSTQAPEIRRLVHGEETDSGKRLHEDQPHMNRRNFLRLMSAQVTTNTVEWMMPVADEEEVSPLPFYQGNGEVQRPMIYQQLLAVRISQLPWEQGVPLPWQSRRLDASCSACMVCGLLCPTGALQSVEIGAEKEITFETALCTNCQLCVRLCPEDAVQPAEIHDADLVASPRTLLMHRTLQQCTNCGHTFDVQDAREELCPVCSNEQDLDEEWLQMLQG